MSKTELKNRILWFDGDSSYPPDNILHDGFVQEITKEIDQYNKLVSSDKQLRIKTKNRSFNFDWIIPEEYKTLNIIEYITDELMKDFHQNQFSENELEERIDRVLQELILFKKYGLEHVLRVLIFIINTLTNQGVVYGVGRGSSVSSYVLYLIRVHDVDSFAYNLDIIDFLH